MALVPIIGVFIEFPLNVWSSLEHFRIQDDLNKTRTYFLDEESYKRKEGEKNKEKMEEALFKETSDKYLESFNQIANANAAVETGRFAIVI